ncbi:hypothetical protein BS47DRAFT_1402319 [Hydnum rufescens UP504]|uniref:Uncharacterized protein n=1 Tax=Hydnum rufescens UP504 TaxID=1448309 RepID=A0A9P6ADF8_9AGAM|nr:hypothetical protein BS47DRAFT_1402319 [Hydnum rufescens UP504]
MPSAAATSVSNTVGQETQTRLQFGLDWRNNRIMEWHHSPHPRPTKISTLRLRERDQKDFKTRVMANLMDAVKNGPE